MPTTRGGGLRGLGSMLVITWEALDALSHQFELCGIGPRSRVIALLQDGPLAELARAALARSRADVLDVRSVHRPDDGQAPLGRNPLLHSLLASADVIVDGLGEPAPIAVPVHARLLRLQPPAVDAHRWPPHANLGHRVDRAVEHVEKAKVLYLGDRHGTSLEVRVDGALVDSDGGRPAEDGDAAAFPSGWVRLTPAKACVDGQVVLMPGDVNLARGAHIDAPIRLEIRNDLITTIDGDHASADVLRALLERFDRADAYGAAHLGLGLNPGCARPPRLFDDELLDPIVSQLRAGVVTLAFGENLVADRPCPGVTELVLPGRTVVADTTALSVEGELVGDVAPDVYEAPG